MMTHARGPVPREDARILVEETLRIGVTLTDVVSRLIEDLPDDVFPGEDTAEVLVEMVAGSVRPAVEAAGPQVVHGAIALIGAVGDRVADDLRRALEIARRNA